MIHDTPVHSTGIHIIVGFQMRVAPGSIRGSSLKKEMDYNNLKSYFIKITCKITASSTSSQVASSKQVIKL